MRCPATCAAAPAIGRSSPRRRRCTTRTHAARPAGAAAASRRRRRARRRATRSGLPRSSRRSRARTLAYEAHGRRWWSPRTTRRARGRAASRIRTRASSPAPPTSGCGSPSITATSATSSTPATSRELRAIRETPTHLGIGAAASLTDAFAALDAAWPELHEAWARFASVPIRNSGTLGGNVANGSPIGDSMPALIALGATVVAAPRRRHARAAARGPLPRATRRRRCSPASSWPSVRVPRRARRPPAARLQVSKRYDQDISAVFALLRADARRRPHRAARASAAAASRPRRSARRRRKPRSPGQPWNEATADAAVRALASEFTPIDDMRATAAYRRARAGQSPAPLPARDRGARACARASSTLQRGDRRDERTRTPLRATHRARRRRAACRTTRRALHVAGEARYTDDLPEPRGTLHAALGVSPSRTARCAASTWPRCARRPGVVAVVTAADIPGVNDVGPIQHDDPIFARRAPSQFVGPAGVRRRRHRRATPRAARRSSRKLDLEPLPRDPHHRRRARRASRTCCRRCT